MRNQHNSCEVVFEFVEVMLSLVTPLTIPLAGVILLFLISAPPAVGQQAIQHKACASSVCSFDNPVNPGNSVFAVSTGTSNCPSDSQGNSWQLALVVPYNAGTPLCYAPFAAGGLDTISTSGTKMIIAEYPPVIAFDGANYGTSNAQNTHSPQGASDTFGWALPVTATQQSELLIAWGLSNTTESNIPIAGPHFEIEDAASNLVLEDSLTERPGLYIGTLRWSSPTLWTLGVATFRVVPRQQGPAGQLVIQKAHCTNSANCSLASPTKPGDTIIVIAQGPNTGRIHSSTSDYFSELYVTGWYGAGDPAPLFYSTNIKGGDTAISFDSPAADTYIAEYPPASFDQISGTSYLCCAPSAAVGPISTRQQNEFLIFWTIAITGTSATFTANSGFTVEDSGTSITIEDEIVGPGRYTPLLQRQPSSGILNSALGGAVASFALAPKNQN